MHCPHCLEDLLITERQGIEIDYCPKCRGVWLDRGELDKIIERSLESITPGRAAGHDSPDPGNYPYSKKSKKKKYKSLLEELFDF